MSCHLCDQACQEKTACYPFRWKTATIEIYGCRRHVNEVITALRQVQAQDLNRKTDEPQTGDF